VAKHEGLDEATLDLVQDGHQAGSLSARHRAALAWTDAFLRDPGGDHRKLRRRMLEHFTAPEIVELSAALALFLGFSKIAIALGQAPASMPVTVLPTPGCEPR